MWRAGRKEKQRVRIARGCGPAPHVAPGRSCVVLGLGGVPCLWTLRAVDDLELDRLTLFQGAVADANYLRVVNDHVDPSLALNEPVALGIVEPLDPACDTQRSSSPLPGRTPGKQRPRWVLSRKLPHRPPRARAEPMSLRA